MVSEIEEILDPAPSATPVAGPQDDRKILRPMEGVKFWKNPKNKFAVVEIHYSADPAKRPPEWAAAIKPSMPRRDWEREYEMKWETWEGLPVYPDFLESFHGVDGPIYPHLGLPLLRGWDFGLTPAAIICQLQEGTLCSLFEFTAFNMGIERFSEIVVQQCQVLFPAWGDTKKDWLDFIDPAGFARKDTDEKTCAAVLQGPGRNLRVQAGAIAWEARRKSVEHYLMHRYNNGPAYKISLPNCRTLVDGFKGGYHYPKEAGTIEPQKLRPVKNKYSHIHDALQMVASKLRPVNRRPRSAAPPPPSYGFTRERNV